MTKSMDFYFNDLNEHAQNALLELVGASNSKEMNWDMDIMPLFTYEVEIDETVGGVTSIHVYDIAWDDDTSADNLPEDFIIDDAEWVRKIVNCETNVADYLLDEYGWHILDYTAEFIYKEE